MADAGEHEPMAHYQIGRVAQRTELSITTLRHYDEVGLVSPSARSDGGFRLYIEEDVQRLLVIRRMKPLEFTLEEMKKLLSSLDTVADPAAAAADKESASDFVKDCHTRAEESCQRLRRRLAYAEELTESLAKLSAQTVIPA